jgi:hypothetical protein
LIFRKNTGGGGGGVKAQFAGVFEGGFGNTVCSGWCFCGEVVVDYVVNVVLWMGVSWR